MWLIYLPTVLPAVTHMRLPIFRGSLLGYYNVTIELPAVKHAPTDIQSTIARLVVYNVQTELLAVTHMRLPLFRA